LPANLTAISGETVSFVAGGEIISAGIDDDGDITIELHPFGVTAFTPTVLARTDELASVRKSAPCRWPTHHLSSTASCSWLYRPPRGNAVDPASGQSLAIAGLVRADQTSRDKVPGLGDIPILAVVQVGYFSTVRN
jgi:pilus assembly protein CpaC